MKLRSFKFIWNFWPPFLGLGISIKSVSPDNKSITVILKKRPWTANYFGTQYGGGIFAMTDGIHALLLYNNLPKDYHLWDKSAKIDYLKRGTTELHADFTVTDEQLRDIVDKLNQQPALDWTAVVEIKDKQDQTVATVERTISIKRKKNKPTE